MYTDRKHYQIVLVAIAVMLVMSLLITSGAFAKNDKPPKPDKDSHDNGQVLVSHKDKDGKMLNVSCHSRHAREAGIACGENDQPAATEALASTTSGTTTTIPAVYPANIPIFAGGGGGSSICHNM